VSIMRRLCLIVFVALLFSSCTTVPKRPPTVTGPPAKTPQAGWWYARFGILWPKDSKPYWHIDAAIAHQVIRPVLEAHSKDIYLWRFHRRAVRDSAGHQFSFIFYTSSKSATQIYKEIQANGFLQWLQDEGWITRVAYDDTSLISKPDKRDTSDHNWSKEIQESWPYYIMGASQMWLSTLTQICQEYQEDHPLLKLEQDLEAYKKIYDSLTYLWQEEGGHAFLHHLYALFGYVPVKVRQADLLMRF